MSDPATRIDVCIPWRATESRLPAFEYVTAWWENNGFNVILGESPEGPFNVSAARNDAVSRATSDVVIVADADTIPELENVRLAVEAAERIGGVWWPFTEYRYLADDVTPGDDLVTAPVADLYPNSVGGLFITARDTYWAVGGMDERFTGWGGEDRAFEIAANTLSTFHRVEGTVWAFNHVADRNMRGSWRGHIRVWREAAGNREAVQRLIEGNRR